MKRNIGCCFLALLLLANVATSAVASEDSEDELVLAAAANMKLMKERRQLDNFRVFYNPTVEAEAVSGLAALIEQVHVYFGKSAGRGLKAKFKIYELPDGAWAIVWLES